VKDVHKPTSNKCLISLYYSHKPLARPKSLQTVPLAYSKVKIFL
jgi:hypothetical protein